MNRDSVHRMYNKNFIRSWFNLRLLQMTTRGSPSSQSLSPRRARGRRRCTMPSWTLRNSWQNTTSGKCKWSLYGMWWREGFLIEHNSELMTTMMKAARNTPSRWTWNQSRGHPSLSHLKVNPVYNYMISCYIFQFQELHKLPHHQGCIKSRREP